MEEPGRSNQLAPVADVPISGTSGPSESEILQNLMELVHGNRWPTKFMAYRRLVAMRPQGHDGAGDTPPARL